MSLTATYKPSMIPAGAAEGLFYSVLIFAVFSHGAVEPWSLAVSHLGVCGIFLLWFAAGRAGSGGKAGIPIIFYLILALLAWGLVSTAWFSIYRHASVQSLLKLTDYLLVALFVYNRFGERDARKRLLWFVAILGVTVAGWGLIRYFAVTHGLLDRVRNEAVGATAPFVNHNHFAGFLELTLCAGAGLFAATWRRIRLESSILLGAALVLMFVALLFSLSRGGILSLLAAAGFFCMVFLIGRSGKAAWSPVMVLVMFALGYLWVLQTDRVEARLKTLGDEQTMSTLNSRTTAWRSSGAAIRERPLAGYGPGTFAWVYPKFREAGLTMRFRYAHNDYLQTWVEYGLVGIGLVLAAVGAFLSGLYRVFMKPADSESYLAFGCAAGILALILHSMTDFNLQLHANALLFVCLAALFSRKVQDSRRNRGRRSIDVYRIVAPAVLVLCLAGAWLSVPALKADLLARQAQAEASLGNDLPAAGLFRSAFELVPGSGEYACGAGQQYALAAAWTETAFFREEASRYLDRAVQLNPHESRYWIQKAFLDVTRGDSLSAERSLERALTADPMNPACYFYLSDFLLGCGELKRAVRSSRLGLAIHPGLFGQRLGRVWLQSRDPSLLGRLVPEGYDRGHFLLAQHLYNNGLFADAARELGLCAAKTKWDNPWFTLAGRCYQSLGMPDSAEWSCRLGIKKRPPELQCYRMLAGLLAGQGRDGEVRAVFEEGLREADVGEQGPLRYEYALYLGRRNDYGGMRREIETALRGDINNAAYLELLADSYLGENRYYEALKELRRVEALRPGRTVTLKKIAEIYRQTGQVERVREYCGKILTLAADDDYARATLTGLGAE